MVYTLDDIDFSVISAKEFENLCYDLIVKFNFQNPIWRDGGSDSGRDIEATYISSTPFNIFNQKWFFECKHYTKGVPPADLNSKIAWADAEKPEVLVLFISSYISNPTRNWLKLIEQDKKYKIVLIEGVVLKNLIINYKDLVERYFSKNKYELLFKNIKDYTIKFSVLPSYEVLKEILDRIDYNKLDFEDIGFLLFNFYKQFENFKNKAYYGFDFKPNIVNKLLLHLKNNITNQELVSFEPYQQNYKELDGYGFIDDIDYATDFEVYLNFQYYHLHLNSNQQKLKWKKGDYLFIFFEDVAFEIFKQNETEIRIIKNFTTNDFSNLSLLLNKEMIDACKGYHDLYITLNSKN